MAAPVDTYIVKLCYNTHIFFNLLTKALHGPPMYAEVYLGVSEMSYNGDN